MYTLHTWQNNHRLTKSDKKIFFRIIKNRAYELVLAGTNWFYPIRTCLLGIKCKYWLVHSLYVVGEGAREEKTIEWPRPSQNHFLFAISFFLFSFLVPLMKPFFLVEFLHFRHLVWCCSMGSLGHTLERATKWRSSSQCSRIFEHLCQLGSWFTKLRQNWS